MQKEWSSLRITLLLYFAVLLLPFSFYFIYTSFQTMQKDTTIVRQSSWIPGAIENVRIDLGQRQIEGIDKAFEQISLWTKQNNPSDLYIGKNTLAEDFREVVDCWTIFKTKGNVQCYDISNDLAIVIEKMVYLKQKKIINVFYISLALAMILILLTIYLVRTYIHIQMKKHAIHDHETNLFNQKYFLAHLHSTFSDCMRHQNALSLLFVSLKSFTHTTYDKQTKIRIMKELGDVFVSVIRTSDIACRYDEGHFAVLLPLTNKEQALILQDRLADALHGHDFKVNPEIEFGFATEQADVNESEEAFIEKVKKHLSS